MPSVPLKRPTDLAAYTGPTTTAHLTIFYNTPARANEYLVVVFGTNTFGSQGELAHLPMPEAVFNHLAEQYPVAKKSNLLRSQDFSVDAALQMLQQHWPPESESSASVPE